MSEDSKIDVDTADLEGPRIDRRTTLKLMGAAGLIGSVAGCVGGSGDSSGGSDGGSGGGGGSADETETSSDTETSGSAKMGGSIEMGALSDNFNFLDPHYVDKGVQMEVQSNVFNGLLKLDPNSEIIGDAAADWEIPDNTTYVFTLNEGMTFHNGDPLNAESVKWSMERLMRLDDSGHHGKVATVESVEATGELEVTVNMTEPTAPFLAFMTNVPGRAGAIVHPSADEDPEAYNRMPIGSGPFKVVDHQTGESLTLEKHTEYHETDSEGNALPYLDEVTVNLIPEPSTMWSAISSGSIKLANELTGQFAKQGEGMSSMTIEKTSPGDWLVLAPLGSDPTQNTELAKLASGYEEITTKWDGADLPTADKRVRQAIAMAIDREAIVEKAFFGFALPAHSLLNPGTGRYYEAEPENGQYYDPEGAKALLDEAGYTGSPRFSFSLLGLPQYERWMTIIQQQLADVDIEMELDIQQPTSYWDQIYRYEHMVTTYSGATDIDPYMSWWKQLGTPDAETSLGVWTKSMMFNDEFDAALQKSFQTADPAEREQYVQQAEDIFLDLAMYTTVVFPLKPKAIDSDLKGVDTSAGMNNFHRAYLAE